MTKPLPPAQPASELEKLIQQAQSQRHSFELAHSPAELWPHLSQTDQVNQLIGLQPTVNTFDPSPLGGASMTVETKEMIFPQSYREWPYEWQAPVWLRVDRVFIKGFLKYLGFYVKLEKTAAGGTRVTLELSFVPLLPALIIKAVLKDKLAKLEQAYKAIDARITSADMLTAEVFARETKARKAQIDALNARWSGLMPASEIPARIAAFVLTAPDAYVRRMRPFELAQRYGFEPMQTLRFFLLAAKEGFLSMSWDARCSSCQGAKQQTDQLQTLTADAHCESCALDYLVAFDQNLELTFAPAASIRETAAALFCHGGPANTPHIVAQYNLEPGHIRELNLNLPPGDYRLRALSLRNALPFRINAAASSRLVVLDLEESLDTQSFESASPLRLRLHNPRPELQTIKIENLNWNPHAVTAALVASLQEFRELFHLQQLPTGLRLPVNEQSFCFFGLKQAAELFRQLGDEAAFALQQEYLATLTEIVRDFQGAVVKTMGDTLMAVFQNPGDALAASLEALEQFQRWNEAGISPIPLRLQIGCAMGPSLVIGTGDNTDYIGETVSRAARLQRACPAGQLLLDPDLRFDAEVADFLEQHACRPVASEIGEADTAYALSPEQLKAAV